MHVSADAGAVQRETEFFFSEHVRNTGFTAQLSNCSLCLIKPHVVASGHAGAIIDRILDEGFEISAISSVFLSRNEAEDLMSLYKTMVRDFPQTID